MRSSVGLTKLIRQWTQAYTSITAGVPWLRNYVRLVQKFLGGVFVYFFTAATFKSCWQLLCTQVLNDVVVDHGLTPFLCSLDVYVDRHLITTVQGDGDHIFDYFNVNNLRSINRRFKPCWKQFYLNWIKNRLLDRRSMLIHRVNPHYKLVHFTVLRPTLIC